MFKIDVDYHLILLYHELFYVLPMLLFIID